MQHIYKLINKYIEPGTFASAVYWQHVTCVTTKALRIAAKLNLEDDQLVFIEEAAMLHDIGICRVNALKIGCHGPLPYLQHITEGKSILEQEGYPQHALIALEHVGFNGLSKEEVKKNDLPLPYQDIVPTSLPSRIINYADIFFSKSSKHLLKERTLDEVKQKAIKFGPRASQDLAKMISEFEL